MSFGVQQSQKTGGSTLTGFIAEKAVQSRDDAKQEKEKQQKIEEEGGEVKEEDKKNLFGKALAHNLGGGFLSGKKSFGENFNHKMPPKPETPAGGGGGGVPKAGSGLAKILTGGFGALVADTTAIQGGLSGITQLLNSQLQSSSFTSSGISGIQAILADQLESQGEMIELMGGEKPTASSGGGASNMFGMTQSTKTGGGTLTDFIAEKWNQIQGAITFITELMEGGGIAGLLARMLPGPVAEMLGLGGAEAAAAGGGAAAAGGGGLAAAGTAAASGAAVVGVGLGASYAGEASRSLGDQWRKLDNKKRKEVLNNPILSNVLMIPPFTPLGIAAKTGMIPDQLLSMTADPIARELDGTSAVLETVGAPFRALFELAMAGGDVKKSNAKMAEIDANLRENFRQVIDPNGKKGSWGSAWGDEYGSAESRISHSSGSVMLGEAGKEAVVDLNSADAAGMKGAEDPGMKASGASMLAVVDQFVKGMGPLGSPVAQALGPDVQTLARQFGMSQALPNLKIGGGKFKEDGKSKREKNKFLENLISGSLEALGAKKKDDDKKTGGATPPPPGDPNQQRSQQRGEDTKKTLENIPGAGAAMERPDPAGVIKHEGEQQAKMTTEKVKGTQVKLGTGDKLTVPSADLNPVANTNQKYWYDSKGQIYKWSPGEQVVQVYLDEVQKQGKADSFDFVRNLTTGVVRKVNTQRDWNPFNNADIIQNGEYSYRANDKLANKSPLTWTRQNQKGDIGGPFGPEVKIPKQSTLTSFEDGGWFQRLTRWLTTPMIGPDASKKAVRSLQGSAQSGKMGGVAQSLANERKMYEELGIAKPYASGGSMFGVTKTNNQVPSEKRVDDLEKMTKMLASMVGSVTTVAAPAPAATPSAPPPKVSAAKTPVTATDQVADGMSEMAVINVIQSGGGSAPTIPVESESPQNTADYFEDPSAAGLASVLCVSSPWGTM